MFYGSNVTKGGTLTKSIKSLFTASLREKYNRWSDIHFKWNFTISINVHVRNYTLCFNLLFVFNDVRNHVYKNALYSLKNQYARMNFKWDSPETTIQKMIFFKFSTRFFSLAFVQNIYWGSFIIFIKNEIRFSWKATYKWIKNIIIIEWHK